VLTALSREPLEVDPGADGGIELVVELLCNRTERESIGHDRVAQHVSDQVQVDDPFAHELADELVLLRKAPNLIVFETSVETIPFSGGPTVGSVLELLATLGR